MSAKRVSMQATLAENDQFQKMARTPGITNRELVKFVRDVLGGDVSRTTVQNAANLVFERFGPRQLLPNMGETIPPAPPDMEAELRGPEPSETIKTPIEPPPAGVISETEVNSAEQSFSGDNWQVRYKAASISTLEEVLAHHQVDRTLWDIKRWTAKPYQGYIKTNHYDAEGRKHHDIKTVQLHSIFVEFQKLKGVEAAKAVIADLLADAATKAPIYPQIVYPRYDKGQVHLLELALFDAHVGKMCWFEETGSEYDLETARTTFLNAVERLMSMASGFAVDRVLLPIGNDFYNSEGKRRSTTAGTPQEDVCRWQKSFTTGRRLVVEAIDRLQTVAPVDVVMVPGNHDHERIYHLGEVLEAWYRNCNTVTVNNQPSPRKFFEYGKVLLMFTHGDEEAGRDLPGIMATAHPEMWGRSSFREVHTGHFHKKREVRHSDVDEHLGVRVRTIPALSGVDAWHHGRGYHSQRGAEAFIFHPEEGCVGTFSHNLR